MINRTYVTIENTELRTAMLTELFAHDDSFITNRTAMPDDFILIEEGRVLEVAGTAFCRKVPAIRTEAFSDGKIPSTGTLEEQLDGTPWVVFEEGTFHILSTAGREIVSRYAERDLGPAPSFQEWLEREEDLRELDACLSHDPNYEQVLRGLATYGTYGGVDIDELNSANIANMDVDCEPCCCNTIGDIID